MTPQLSEAALRDLDEIWSYIAQDSPRAADRLIARLLGASEKLGDFPELGISRDDLAAGLRALRAGNYILFYSRRGEGLTIDRVLHARLDITGWYF